MEKSLGALTWTENDSDSFVTSGNVFVPDRARQYQRVCNIIPKATSPFNVLDICCGEGLLSLEIAKKSPFYEMYCYDGSPLMLENAKKQLSRLPNKAYFEIFDLNEFEQSKFPEKCQAVVSSLAIHHLEDKRKLDLFKYVNTLLPLNGLFVVIDVIMPVCKEAAGVAAEDWEIAACKQSIDYTGNFDAYKIFQEDKWNIYHYLDDKEYMAYDKPSTIYDQLKWLDISGFSKVDILWMYAGHVIYYGIK
jgi:tRNA (cmo5U34)-methyltransferase